MLLCLRRGFGAVARPMPFGGRALVELTFPETRHMVRVRLGVQSRVRVRGLPQ